MAAQASPILTPRGSGSMHSAACSFPRRNDLPVPPEVLMENILSQQMWEALQ